MKMGTVGRFYFPDSPNLTMIECDFKNSEVRLFDDFHNDDLHPLIAIPNVKSVTADAKSVYIVSDIRVIQIDREGNVTNRNTNVFPQTSIRLIPTRLN